VTRTVHQYWDRNIPFDVAALVEQWRSVPGFSHKLYDDIQTEDFISDRFGERAAAAFRRCAIPAMRSDFFRYAVLLDQGGIYADADTAPVGDIPGLYERTRRGLLFIRKGDPVTDFMIFKKPGDPLLQLALQNSIANIEQRVSDSVYVVTGPWVVTRLYRNIDPHPPDLFNDIDLPLVDELSKDVGFHWNLSHRANGKHWSEVQKTQSIFSD
jgi:mannosyltransferase OCH1-like enzyme